MRHSSRRADQAIRHRDYQASSPSNTTASARAGFVHDDYSDEEEQEYAEKHYTVNHNHVVPYVDSVKLKWKWSPASGNGNEGKSLVKERSIFVGCIPDGVDDITMVLQSLMESFLERFDFAPVELGQVQVVRVVKDFAFLELATDKIAQIVLAANQLDVFEWGISGYHFNIEGCNGTHTSVRPLVEYIPLRPARVVFVGNVPKSCWQKEFLEDVFTRILWGSDGQTDMKPVVSVYLLPDSSDVYVELASEFVADALIYKCSKNDQLLKEIGEEVFICRDINSPPMMSRHKVDICAQRSLFIGISAREENFKIDCIRKVFDDILPLISRKINQYAYLEYISVQPGKDYAFFQFNSETVTDAIMDEYVENTQLFVCKNSPLTYIILRPPEYIRPGARYHSVNVKVRRPCCSDAGHNQHHKGSAQASGTNSLMSRARVSNGGLHSGMVQAQRRFGDEPARKTDCVMSIGASPLPVAKWNSPGASAADLDSLVVIEGLTKGFSYKLLRGALNELFERLLSQTGLLEVGMLVLGYLDRDDDLDIVACLPNADFAYALLSLRQSFVVCGHEIQLLPKDTRRNCNGRFKAPVSAWGQDELSLSEEDGADAGYVRASFHNDDMDDWNGTNFSRDRKRGFVESNADMYDVPVRGPNIRRKFHDDVSDEWYQGQGMKNALPKNSFQSQQRDRNWNGYHPPRANGGLKSPGLANMGNRVGLHSKEPGRGLKRGFRRFN